MFGMFIAGYLGILIGEMSWAYFKNKKFDIKAVYHGSSGYWLAVFTYYVNK